MFYFSLVKHFISLGFYEKQKCFFIGPLLERLLEMWLKRLTIAIWARFFGVRCSYKPHNHRSHRTKVDLRCRYNYYYYCYCYTNFLFLFLSHNFLSFVLSLLLKRPIIYLSTVYTHHRTHQCICLAVQQCSILYIMRSLL